MRTPAKRARGRTTVSLLAATLLVGLLAAALAAPARAVPTSARAASAEEPPFDFTSTKPKVILTRIPGMAIIRGTVTCNRQGLIGISATLTQRQGHYELGRNAADSLYCGTEPLRWEFVVDGDFRVWLPKPTRLELFVGGCDDPDATTCAEKTLTFRVLPRWGRIVPGNMSGPADLVWRLSNPTAVLTAPDTVRVQVTSVCNQPMWMFADVEVIQRQGLDLVDALTHGLGAGSCSPTPERLTFTPVDNDLDDLIPGERVTLVVRGDVCVVDVGPCRARVFVWDVKLHGDRG